MTLKELYETAVEMKVEDLEIREINQSNYGLQIKLQEKDKYNFHIITI